MILTYEKIEVIAASILTGIVGDTKEKLQLIPIEEIAIDYYNLNIKYLNLSDDGHILGLTAYEDTNCLLKVNGVDQIVPIYANEIVLDKRFINSSKKQELHGKHRFTLAHEVAHQIIYRLENIENQAIYTKGYSMRQSHTVKQLKTWEDFNEWQANALGAALLMPLNSVRLLMYLINEERALTNYEGRFSKCEYNVLKHFCNFFEVSKTAAIIRLRQLGYIVDKNYYDYKDPLDIVYEEY